MIAALEGAKLTAHYPYIVCVPPKPKQASRFDALLNLIGEQMKGKMTVCADGLRCVKDYGSIKGLKPDARREAVKGAFQSKYDWGGKNVLLIDDVLTSAATTMECVRMLKGSKAGTVLVAALGKDQSALEQKLCPACGRSMKVRTDRRGEQFWGCSGFLDKQNQCRHTENIAVAVSP